MTRRPSRSGRAPDTDGGLPTGTTPSGGDSPKKSVRLFGSLGTDGYHIRATDAINSETFIEFLQELLKTCPKFVMVPDNASCHKSKMVTEFVESTDGRHPAGVPAPVHPAAEPHRDAVERAQAAALGQVLSVRRGTQKSHNGPCRQRRDETRQVNVLPDATIPRGSGCAPSPDLVRTLGITARKAAFFSLKLRRHTPRADKIQKIV